MATDGKRNYRPKFHYTPEKGWINDPNGLVFDGEKYHLFAQHYPADTKWGPMHWSHAISDDMIHWHHLPIALYPDALGMCFSGSACIKDGKVALMYTSHGDMERQSVAFSDDNVYFTPYAGNPVIDNPGLRDYRDPKMFPRADGRFGVAVAAGDHVEFFASDDLVNWEKTGEFSDQSRVTGIHECPDMFPLAAPDGSKIYCMIASMIVPEGGNRTQYVLGDFDGKKFDITIPFPVREWVDAGWDNYAPVTFWGTDKPIVIGWASCWRYADRLPTDEYCGAMTFPREASLVETNVGLRLAQKPLVYSITGAYAKTDVLPGEHFRLRVKADGDFSVKLVNKAGEQTVISLKNGEYTIDRTASGECGAAADILNECALAKRARYMSGSVEMDVIFDASIMEVFSDSGTYAATTAVFPTSPYEKVIAEGCEIEIAPLV